MKAKLAIACAILLVGFSPGHSEELYISGYGTGTLSTVNPSGVQTVLQSGLGAPEGLAFDGSGSLYLISGPGNNQTILKFATDGTTSRPCTREYLRTRVISPCTRECLRTRAISISPLIS